jgi:hypothetical protein
VEAAGEEILRLEIAADLDDAGDQPGPARLVAGAEPGAVVAVEVLVEQDLVLPLGIGLEALGVGVTWRGW